MDDSMDEPTPREDMPNFASDQNPKYMQERGELAYLIDGLLRERLILPDGTTKEQVAAMTQFQQIDILEQIIEKEDEVFAEPLSHPLVVGINTFLEKVNKDDFKTATDMDLEEKYITDCPYCDTGGRVGPSHVGNKFYCYGCCETFY